MLGNPLLHFPFSSFPFPGTEYNYLDKSAFLKSNNFSRFFPSKTNDDLSKEIPTSKPHHENLNLANWPARSEAFFRNFQDNSAKQAEAENFPFKRKGSSSSLLDEKQEENFDRKASYLFPKHPDTPKKPKLSNCNESISSLSTSDCDNEKMASKIDQKSVEKLADKELNHENTPQSLERPKSMSINPTQGHRRCLTGLFNETCETDKDSEVLDLSLKQQKAGTAHKPNLKLNLFQNLTPSKNSNSNQVRNFITKTNVS